MKTFNTIFVAVIISLVLVYAGFLLFAEPPIGSVEPMGGYDYTQYTAAVATNTQVMAGPGIFGSVIITEDCAGTIVFYDATSTAALSGASTLYSTIADFQATSAEGTYTFDANLKHGLVFVTTTGYNFAADMTVTYRQGY